MPDGSFRFHKGGTDFGAMCMLGTFAKKATISQHSVVKIDDWLPLETAVLVGCGVPTGWGGRYIVTLSAGWASVPGTSASLSGVVNGSYTDGATCSSDISATTLTMVRTFAAGNTLKFQARQNSGGAINLVSRLEVAWLGV